MIPRDTDIIKSLKALENLSCKHNSNKSYTNAEKVLKLPKNPIETNNTNL